MIPIARGVLVALAVFSAWSIAGTQISAACLVVLLTLLGGARSAPRVRNWTLAFTGVCVASAVFSGLPPSGFESTAWKPTLLLWVAASGVALLGRNSAERGVVGWVVAAAAASVWGCIQAATGADLLFLLHLRSVAVTIPSPGWAGHAAATGFFNSRLTFSLALLPAFGAAGGLAIAGSGWRRWVGCGALAIMGVALALGFVRAAWWGALVAGATLIALGPRRLLWPAAGLCGLGVLVALAIPQVRARALSGLRVEDNEDRVFIWERAREVIADHPVFGVGFGAYPRAAEPYYDRVDPSFPMHTWAHNTPLSLLAELGPIGLLLFVLLWGAVFGSGWPALRAGSPSALGLFAGVVGLLAAALFHDILYNGEVAYSLYLAGGLFAGLGLVHRPVSAAS